MSSPASGRTPSSPLSDTDFGLQFDDSCSDGKYDS